MTGLLSLVGGREHTPGCEPIDRHLLAATRTSRPVVTVVPFASSLRTRARTVGLAVGWWERLGAEVLVAAPESSGAVRSVGAADVVVLTGGVPDRLHRRLDDHVVWQAIRDAWLRGAHLTGSSSGAMVAAAWRQSVRPPFAVRPGLGLVADLAVAPHHDLALPRAVASWRAHTHPHLVIAGIDERTALVGCDGRFEVRGTGTVTLRRGRWSRTLRHGDRYVLPGRGTPRLSAVS